MTAFFNTGLSQQQFLDEYWQKKPLLIRQAFVDFETPISPDELAGLAAEPEIESRLIEEQGETGAWQVTNGPLSEQDFAKLPETHWTMLVQDVDKHLPELQTLFDPLRFIPDWRRDDLMISFAPEHGTVGPHTDGYDVFLLQALGERCWQIGAQAQYDIELIAGLELQIMADFEADQTWVLSPGDLLYLPPHFAHYGVALNDCMTFSFGFRAPSQVELLDGVVNTLLEHNLAKIRYGDPDLKVSDQSSEIDVGSIKRLKQLLHQTIDNNEEILTEVLGRFVTETKQSLVELAAEQVDDKPTIEQVNTLFEQGEQLQRNIYSRVAWTNNNDSPQLFVAGEAYCVDSANSVYLSLLAENTQLNNDDWQQLKQQQQLVDLVCHLIADGVWFWSE